MSDISTASTPCPAADGVLGELIRHQLSSSRPAFGSLVRRLDEAVRAYEVELRRYLSRQRRPPFELGSVLATAFQELASDPRGRCAGGFRVEALEARFHAAERLLVHRLDRGDRRPRGRVAHPAA